MFDGPDPARPLALALDIRHGGPLAAGGRVLGPMRLDVAVGETVALTGPSGVGKSTLLRLAAGLDRGFAGTRRSAGRLAVVFQDPALLPWRSAGANLCLATGIGAGAAADWLARVGLPGLHDSFPGQLSLGQQRRLALARAFAADPDLLLMDEPFVSLDPATAEAVLSLYERLRDERRGHRPLATLLVTHSATEAARLATRTLALTGRPARLTG
ncbi:ATP-binding cassette domain-containing protein [Frigidibacter sp. MR17.24]|uniref:ATP-binding cassette domain-containing protein n=1 Tax=Frigidibacter sp. MR17.24 TaxID=3127345 RepID=UPI0030131776